MKRWQCLVVAVVLVGGAGCRESSSQSGGNWLIGTWTLSQPNPPVAGQSDKDCVTTKWNFTPAHYQTYMGEKTGGPEISHYVVEGENIFLTGPYNNIAFTQAGKDRMYWSAPYGRCYYVRG